MKDLIQFDKINNWTVEIDPRRVDVNKLKFYHSQGVIDCLLVFGF